VIGYTLNLKIIFNFCWLILTNLVSLDTPELWTIFYYITFYSTNLKISTFLIIIFEYLFVAKN